MFFSMTSGALLAEPVPDELLQGFRVDVEQLAEGAEGDDVLGLGPAGRLPGDLVQGDRVEHDVGGLLDLDDVGVVDQHPALLQARDGPVIGFLIEGDEIIDLVPHGIDGPVADPDLDHGEPSPDLRRVGDVGEDVVFRAGGRLSEQLAAADDALAGLPADPHDEIDIRTERFFIHGSYPTLYDLGKEWTFIIDQIPPFFQPNI